MTEPTARQLRTEEVFARLFGPRDTSAPDRDPEFGEILRRLIFGDVFATGVLDDRTRELVTVTCLGPCRPCRSCAPTSAPRSRSASRPSRRARRFTSWHPSSASPGR